MRIASLCNECGERAEFDRQTEAFAWCQRHEIMTSHANQLVSTPANGWSRYHPIEVGCTPVLAEELD